MASLGDCFCVIIPSPAEKTEGEEILNNSNHNVIQYISQQVAEIHRQYHHLLG